MYCRDERDVSCPSAVAVAVASLLIVASSNSVAAIGCSSLATLTFVNTTIVSTALVPAAGNLPEYCRVEGHVDTAINFELRLPAGWNGKFLFQGFGGLDGALPSVTHTLNLGSPGSPIGLRRGYAVVTTDTGHKLPPGQTNVAAYGDWAINNPEAQVNWAHRSTHVVAEVAKAIIANYYGRQARYSYYHGCSGGGRHATMVAQKYPNDFDGVVAAAPWLKPTHQVMAMNWQLQKAGTLLSKLPLIGNEALKSCDAKDGVVDGLISDPRTCHFDPKKLLCDAGDSPDCLTQEQVETLVAIYDGPESSTREQLFPGYARGGEKGWSPAIVPPAGGRSANDLLQDAFLRGFVFGTSYDGKTFDFDSDPTLLTAAGALVNVKPDLSAFEAAGGKMLMWHGWDDARLSPWYSILYQQEVAKALPGNKHQTDDFFRLFMAPGVAHCQGGPGPNTLDALKALEDWVESGIAPDRIIATHFTPAGVPDRTRPLCPYPQQAIYKGHGSTDDAASFVCKNRGQMNGRVDR